jgi:hypothetical protein
MTENIIRKAQNKQHDVSSRWSIYEFFYLIEILYPSTLITKLDDYKLDEASLEKWNTFLLQNDKITKSHYGFCASEKDITSSLDCYDISAAHPYENSEISFQRSNQTNSHRLVDTFFSNYKILTYFIFFKKRN